MQDALQAAAAGHGSWARRAARLARNRWAGKSITIGTYTGPQGESCIAR